MKNYNILFPIALGFVLMSCSNNKNLEKNVFSIDTTHLKQLYAGNEDLKLSLKTTDNAEIDSVAYYLNDKKIATAKNNEVLNYNLANEKLGETIIKGIAYADGQQKEVTTKIEVTSPVTPVAYSYRIVNTYPHDQEAYTQGLEFYKGTMIESTGNGEGGGTAINYQGTGKKGVSSVRHVDYKTGQVTKIHKLPMEIFGEGCTILNDKLYQLTYQNKEAYVYNPETLEKIKTLPYFKNMEGWGLTNDGTHLYMTGGDETIYKVDPETFTEVDQVKVYINRTAVQRVNELEWVDGKIYANVYGENAIAIINPKTGAVEAIVDVKELLDKTTYHQDRDVLNGIAYNPQTKTFFLTGKNWDKMFEIEIIK